jgi:hypothetical protein
MPRRAEPWCPAELTDSARAPARKTAPGPGQCLGTSRPLLVGVPPPGLFCRLE